MLILGASASDELAEVSHERFKNQTQPSRERLTFPKPALTASALLLGQNRCGNWVVQDEAHNCGGVFLDRSEAVKYALLMNGNRPHAIICVRGPLELDLRRRSAYFSKPA
jgi:hypothetical protein